MKRWEEHDKQKTFQPHQYMNTETGQDQSETSVHDTDFCLRSHSGFLCLCQHKMPDTGAALKTAEHNYAICSFYFFSYLGHFIGVSDYAGLWICPGNYTSLRSSVLATGHQPYSHSIAHHCLSLSPLTAIWVKKWMFIRCFLKMLVPSVQLNMAG